MIYEVSLALSACVVLLTSAPLSPLSDTLVLELAVVVSCPPMEVGGAAPPTAPLSLAAGTPPLQQE